MFGRESKCHTFLAPFPLSARVIEYVRFYTTKWYSMDQQQRNEIKSIHPLWQWMVFCGSPDASASVKDDFSTDQPSSIGLCKR
jgi:hypothetical protein